MTGSALLWFGLENLESFLTSAHCLHHSRAHTAWDERRKHDQEAVLPMGWVARCPPSRVSNVRFQELLLDKEKVEERRSQMREVEDFCVASPVR